MALENAVLTVRGHKATLVVDLEGDLGPSKSGLTQLVASSRGNVGIPNHPGIKMGLNVYREIPAAERPATAD